MIELGQLLRKLLPLRLGNPLSSPLLLLNSFSCEDDIEFSFFRRETDSTAFSECKIQRLQFFEGWAAAITLHIAIHALIEQRNLFLLEIEEELCCDIFLSEASIVTHSGKERAKAAIRGQIGKTTYRP